MAVRVLIVDDSSFFRRALRGVIGSDSRLEIVGEAANGREAIDKACSLKPDVITMDVEMPVLDGISAVREIMQRCPAPILMLSALTHAGAVATLDALEAGAVDFFPKTSADPRESLSQNSRLLCARLRLLAVRGVAAAAGRASATAAGRSIAGAPVSRETPASTPRSEASQHAESGVISRRGAVVIGSSTGGPAALQVVLSAIPADFPVPIVIAQHMPAAFTGPFATRLDHHVALRVCEVEDGAVLRPGTAYVIPGGKHGEIQRRNGTLVFHVREPADSEHFRPSVNIALSSASEALGDDMLGVILTGMGDDGAEGARKVRAGNGTIWSQDRATSVIYGMPAAVAKAGLTQAVLPLNEIGSAIAGSVR